MANELVIVELGSIFHNLRTRVEALRDEVLVEGGKTLREEEEQSIRLRWFNKGRTLESLKEEVATDGDTKIYQLFPTATSKRGFPYPTAGEYGTGRRGAISGRPAPAGWNYGQGVGMTARRYSRIAVANAQPRIEAKAREVIANFTI